MEKIPNVLSREWMVKPSECNAKQQLPLTTLTSQIIELATDHANLLGIGFLNLEPRGLGWVLSRLSIEMKRWPRNGETYKLSTWIESYNAHFSERCFSVTLKDGEAIGYARTIWMIIDLKTHLSAGTAGTVMPSEYVPALPCPIPKYSKHKAFEPQHEDLYVFKYMDLDFYRHVNTVRYISILLNLFTLAEMDTNILSRFDIAFAHEAKYGEEARILSREEDIATPGMTGREGTSRRRVFEMIIKETPVLSASVVLTQL